MKTLRLCCAVALIVLLAGALGMTASAQNYQWKAYGSSSSVVLPTDLLKVNYFSNANTADAGDGTVRITNPGSPTGNICAQIYVFDPYQEMSECCACLLTPDGLRTLSVNADLTSNPLTDVVLTSGSVSIVSGYTNNNQCNPVNNVVTPTFRAWGTHIQNENFAITETPYSDRLLGAYNINLLFDCAAIQLDGSNHGVCSCGSGD